MIVRMKRLTLLCLTSGQGRGARRAARARRGARRPTAGRRPARTWTRCARRSRRPRAALAALPKATVAPAKDRVAARRRTPARRSRRCSRCSTAATRSPGGPTSSARELARYAGFGEFDLEEVRGLERGGAWTEPRRRAAGPAAHGAGRHGAHRARARPRRAALPARGVRRAAGASARPRRPLRAGPVAARAPSPTVARRARRLRARSSWTPASASRRSPPRATPSRALVRETADETRFAEVRAGMDEADELSLLSGYLPAETQDAVRAAPPRTAGASCSTTPSPARTCPCSCKQSRWVAPVRTVFDFLHIYPGYWECGRRLGLPAVLQPLLRDDRRRRRLRRAPARRSRLVLQWRLKKVPAHVFHMMYIVGVATLVWGVDHRQLLRHPDAAAVPRVARGAVGRTTATTSSTCASSSAPCTSRSRTSGTP